MEKLLPPNDKICGCELWVPDTALFDDGRLKLVFRTDPKDGCLTQQPKLFNLQELRRQFSLISRERKKDQVCEGGTEDNREDNEE